MDLPTRDGEGELVCHCTESQTHSCANLPFLSHLKESFLTFTLVKIQNRKSWIEKRRGRERKQVLSNPHFKPEWGYILIWAASGTSFNLPTTSALMDHVVPQKTQCESIFYLVLFSASTLIYKEKPHSLRMTHVYRLTKTVQLSDQNKEV